MTYLDANARTNKPTRNDNLNVIGRVPTLFGVFLGFVKKVDDFQRNGRLQVWIPEFGSVEDDEQGWITVNYCSPFAGATNVDTTSKTNLQDFDGTQTSYGFWMIPPDINNQVLVMFIAGDPARGIWIGSMYNQFMNNMIPAMAADTKTYQYPGKPIPAAEYNKWDTKVTQPDRAMKPYQKTKFRGVGNQGLINDKQRGITNTSARREAPSNVYGILTPGPVIDKSAPPEKIRRKGGSSFIMDDGDCTEYIELATKSGSKIRIDESNGNIYVINRDGTAWVEMDKFGNIDMFSATNVSIRSQKDINLRADRNINIEAGQNLFLKAAKDTKEQTTTFTYDINNEPEEKTIPVWKYVGEGAGDGGNIVMQALNNWYSTTQKDAFLTVLDNDMDIRIGKNYSLSTLDGEQNYNSKSDIKLTTNSAFDISVDGNLRISVKGTTSLESQSEINIETGSQCKLNATLFGISAPTRIKPTLDVTDLITGIITYSKMTEIAKKLGPVIPTPGAAPPPADPETAELADLAEKAEVKPLNEKINILATWSDPESKFKRNSEPLSTTVSRFPTYEPCPEHSNFGLDEISGYAPVKTEGDKTYAGSGSAGSSAKESPPANTDPGANNTVVNPDNTQESSTAKDFNMKAFECQIKIHEGVKNKVYLDTLGLPTAGIGHLLRTNEMMPVGTPVSDEQISRWFQADSATSIKDAQAFVGMETWAKLSDNRKRAVADLAYNMGGPRLGQFKNLRAAIQKEDWAAAGNSLRNSKWYTQVGRRGPAVTSQLVNGVDPNGCDKKFPPN